MSEASPLCDPDAWSHAVESANPDAMLVAIRMRLGAVMRQRISEEDVLQETLLRAWAHRHSVQWEGPAAFRRWLLTIAERTVEDHRDYLNAQKRDVRRTQSIAVGDSSTPDVEPWSSTTPSRLAARRERAQALAEALESLPDDLRDVVRLRLFEELSMPEIATRLGLGESALRHRFRKGAELYAMRLKAHDSSTGGSKTGATDAPS
ncbi:MAG: sigma-70 family RNA polymerase sigma factor [Planctomycetes bacterium]|jgi:RNA polymerase sigma-70 factor (ECF subfamily)|nr:sigma-70 family RNA polymerase sigma factor [Planctomycetota bacterium]